MKRLYKLSLSVIGALVLMIMLRSMNVTQQRQEKLKICCVVCGSERTEEALTMLKSALVHDTRNHEIEFFIFTEHSLFGLLKERLHAMRQKKKFSFHLLEVSFPLESDSSKVWRELFKPCAAQRLFIPSLLHDEDFVLYVDTDVLFLESPEWIFAEYKNFAAEQHSGLVHESESKSMGELR